MEQKMTQTQQPKSFETFKKEMQSKYAQLNDREKVLYWTESVYKMYKSKNFPTSVSDKLFFEKIQELMEIEVSEDIHKQVYNLMSHTLKSRQQAVYNIYRGKVQEDVTQNDKEANDTRLVKESKDSFEQLLNRTVISRSNENV